MKQLRTFMLAIFALALFATGCGTTTTLDAAPPTDTVAGGGETGNGDTGNAASLAEPGTTQALLLAPAATREASTYRTEMFMVMEISDLGQDMTMGSNTQPLMVGSIDGLDTAMVMDLGVMFESMFEQMPAGERAQMEALFGGDDLSMEMITVDGTMYMRSAFLANTGGQAAALYPELEVLKEIDTGYGAVDLEAATGMDLSALGIQGSASFDAYLDLIESAADVEVAGTEDVRGVATTKYAIRAGLQDLLDAQGVAAEQLGVDLPASAMDAELDFFVYVDDQGLLRRFAFELDGDTLAELAGEDLGAGMSVSMTMTMDMFDFGDDSISVQAPPADQIVGDLTEAFATLQELGG